jgi:hypothetical protein
MSAYFKFFTDFSTAYVLLVTYEIKTCYSDVIFILTLDGAPGMGYMLICFNCENKFVTISFCNLHI